MARYWPSIPPARAAAADLAGVLSGLAAEVADRVARAVGQAVGRAVREVVRAALDRVGPETPPAAWRPDPEPWESGPWADPDDPLDDEADADGWSDAVRDADELPRPAVPSAPPGQVRWAVGAAAGLRAAGLWLGRVKHPYAPAAAAAVGVATALTTLAGPAAVAVAAALGVVASAADLAGHLHALAGMFT